MSERQMRKMISFKIENLSPKERALVDEWANGQSNIQQSLTNIIMHIVGFVGNADVMDFDIQKKLHITLGDTMQFVPKVETNTMQFIPQAETIEAQYVRPKQTPIRRNKDDEYPDVMDIFADD